MTQIPQEVINLRVNNKEYFKDSKKWFYWKYVSPYKSRFDLLILMLIIFFIITFFVLYSLFSVTSVKGKNGVIKINGIFESEFILEKIPKIYRSNEKNILRFVIEKYIGVFESFDIDKFDVNKIDDKSLVILSHSSKEVGNFFNNQIKKNYEDEVFNGIKREVDIKSFDFIYNNNTTYDKIKRFIMPEKTPNKVVVNITSLALNHKDDKMVKTENREIEIVFSYNKIKRNGSGGFDDLNFKILSYSYLSIK